MTNRLFDPNSRVLVLSDDLPGASPDPADDGRDTWTIGHDLADASGAYALSVIDNCSPGVSASLVSGAIDASPEVYFVKSFAAQVEAKRSTRCIDDGERERLITQLLLDGGLTSAAELVLWNGIPGWNPSLQPFLLNSDVQTVAAGATPADSIAAAVIKYCSLTPANASMLVHLGVKAALDLSATGAAFLDGPDITQNNFRIRAIDAPCVVSPFYPSSGIAVTGPVLIRVGKQDGWEQFDIATNRYHVEGYREVEINFNPSTAVRVV